MIRMLEVGPSDDPLCNGAPDDPNWVNFTTSCSYTVVEPGLHGNDKFPRKYLTLSNVRLIEARAQDADLPENSFDEAFAANVLSDPSVHAWGMGWDLVTSMAKAVRPGGLLTFLETYTPEDGPTGSKLADRLGDEFKIVHSFYEKIACPSAEWSEHVSAYTKRFRAANTFYGPTRQGAFTQLQKQ